jgi:predicted transcriptional regulator
MYLEGLDMTDYAIERNLLTPSLRDKHGLRSLPLSKKYRSYFEIIASIIDALKDGNKDKYCLMRGTGINYAQLKKYLESLARIGFIRLDIRKSQVQYEVTEKGLCFLGQYFILLGMLWNVQPSDGQDQMVGSASPVTFNRPQNTDLRLHPYSQGDSHLFLPK